MAVEPAITFPPLHPAWWAVALTEEVTATPRAVDLGSLPLVLWRDAAGTARALEDRCPHRGVALSLGGVAADGRIACRQHGWRFDGATGRLAAVPGAAPGQSFPENLHARAFTVIEEGGFVRVATGAAPPPPGAGTHPRHGLAEIALGHPHYVAALLDDPALLLSVRGLRLVPGCLAGPRAADGKILVERAAGWHGPRGWFGAPLVLATSTDAHTGETVFRLGNARCRSLLTVVLAPVPARRGVTTIRWRAAGRLPFLVRATIDAAKLRVLEPSISQQVETLAEARDWPGAAD